ncbi:hypothetical protein ABZ322_08115 [Streptomyces sp. NPDC006129]|uniref:hypothetical protein n=1 Tax=Streptomyces sp. NPDC006129 TaxID=3155348 RepID=UPI0033A37D86
MMLGETSVRLTWRGAGGGVGHEFFADLGTDWEHDGSTRHRWVADVLEAMLAEPHGGPDQPPESFCRLIGYLMSPADALNEG